MKKINFIIFTIIFIIFTYTNNAYAMFCDKCGNSVSEEANFCNKCGNNLKVNTIKTNAQESSEVNAIVVNKSSISESAEVKCVDINKINLEFINAVENNNIEEAKKLISKGADVNYYNATFPLFEAIKNKNLEMVKLLCENKTNVNTKISDCTALGQACETNDLKIVEYLIAQGVDVNQKYKMPREDYLVVPLLTAVKNKNLEMVKLLCENKATVNVSLDAGEEYNIFDKACSDGNLQIVEYLISKGADVNAKSYDDWTPICIAIKNEQPNLIKLLLDHGANVNHTIPDNVNGGVITVAAFASESQNEAVKAIFNDFGIKLQKKAANKANNNFSIKGFYIGMSLKEAVDLLNNKYYKEIAPCVDLNEIGFNLGIGVMTKTKFLNDMVEYQLLGQKLATSKIKPIKKDNGVYIYEKFSIVDNKVFPPSLEWDINADKSGNVIKIYFSGVTVNNLFNSKDMNLKEFLDTFVNSYNITLISETYTENKKNYLRWYYYCPDGWKIYIFENKSIIIFQAVPQKNIKFD